MSSNHRDGKDYNECALHKCAKCGAYSKWEGYCSFVCLVEHGASVTGKLARAINDELHQGLAGVRKSLRGEE